MAKPKMVPVSVNLVKAIQDLRTSAQWTQLPLSMRWRIEEGLRGNGGQKVRK